LGHVAPVVRFALAFAAGTGWGLIGAPLWTAPLPVLLSFVAPNRASSRLTGRRVLAWIACLGFLATLPARAETGCPRPVSGALASLEGRFIVTPRSGSAPFERADGCGTVTVVVPDSLGGPAGAARTAPAWAGRPLIVTGIWREGSWRPWLGARRIDPAPTVGGSRSGARWLAELRWRGVGWRDSLVERIHRLYGSKASLVTALTLARREGMAPGVREVFVATGLAHLLAISGFHVGIIAGVALVLLRAAGVGRRSAALGASGVAWAYVALIGFPDAAFRAALILALVAGSRARGRPPSRWGALAAAAVILLALDPRRLASPGFQLSFAGAAGLVAWSRPLSAVIDRATRRRMPRVVTSGVSAGIAATLATLPIVAWHFERVSLVGIPMTLVATPLVSLALPGALASLAVDFVSPPLASFLAGGVSVVLELLMTVAETVAGWPGVSAWTSRGTIVAGLAGTAVATTAARRPRVSGSGRRALLAIHVATAMVAWPLLLTLQGRGSLELMMIDVGQGDAIAIRTPGGRWLLVDAGSPEGGVMTSRQPRIGATDPGGNPVVRALRGRGVDRLEAVVLTHPDLDHIGGVVAVLSSFTVERVIDPALPAPKAVFSDALATAAERGIPWSAARAGQTFAIDGVTFRVLHPSEPLTDSDEGNESSVVILVSWRGFNALLTGDVSVDVERSLIDQVGDLDVLKVGHHGSATSTDSLFLAETRPEVALISVGRRNRYGHPSPDVVRRLTAVGAEIHRTDREGAVRVIVRGDGSYRVRSDRAPVPSGRRTRDGR
jgi:competence protein ComEC